MPTFPESRSAAMLEELNRYVVATPMPFVLDLEKCQGMFLATVDGQQIFDWAGYYGSKLIAHNHPALSDPAYLRRLALAANNKVANPDFLTAECLDYYRLLYRLAPACMQGEGLEVYAVNSGAEAVENMMKYLVAKFNAKKQHKGQSIGNRRFLYFDRAFHGRTVFALNVTQTMDPVATKDFHGLMHGGNLKLPFPAYDQSLDRESNERAAVKALEQVESALALMSEEIVAIIVEPIQGAGGQRVALPEFFQGLSHLAHQHDVYLGFDEVQTGLALTGKMWGIDHFHLPHPPMAVATGKKFGNGAVFMRERLEDIGVLDSTWGGNLADMVRLIREMQIVEEEGLIEKAAEKGKHLESALVNLAEKHQPMMFNVRGLGLYQGFSLDTPERKAQLIETALRDHSLLLLGAGHRSIRTRPNLHVTNAEIDQFVAIIDECLTAIR